MGKKLDEMLRNHDDIPGQMKSEKIILAGDYLGSVYHYMDFKIADHVILQSKISKFAICFSLKASLVYKHFLS